MAARSDKSNPQVRELYFHDSENQLTRIEFYDATQGTPIKTVQYTYDVLNRRIEKKITDHVSSSHSYTRRYVYDGTEIILEMDDSNQILAQYTPSTLGTDHILAAHITSTGQAAGLAPASGSYLLLRDALGSITDITDSSGNILQRNRYTSFGALARVKDGSGNLLAPSNQVQLPFGFTGRESDSESHLSYYRARFFDPEVGRFVEKDPNAGQSIYPNTVVNSFILPGNNPVNFADPAGQGFLQDFATGGMTADEFLKATVGKSGAVGQALAEVGSRFVDFDSPLIDILLPALSIPFRLYRYIAFGNSKDRDIFLETTVIYTSGGLGYFSSGVPIVGTNASAEVGAIIYGIGYVLTGSSYRRGSQKGFRSGKKAATLGSGVAFIQDPNWIGPTFALVIFFGEDFISPIQQEACKAPFTSFGNGTLASRTTCAITDPYRDKPLLR